MICPLICCPSRGDVGAGLRLPAPRSGSKLCRILGIPPPPPYSPGHQVWLRGQARFRSRALAGAQQHHPDTCLPAVGPAHPGPDSPGRGAGVCGAGAGTWGQGPILFLLRLDPGPCNVDFVGLYFAYLHFHFCSSPAHPLLKFCPSPCCLVAQSCPTPCNYLQPARLLRPWDFPGKYTGVACHFLLQGIFPDQGLSPSLLHWKADSLPLSHQGSSLQCLPNTCHAFSTKC